VISPFSFRISNASEYVYGEIPEITVKISNSSTNIQECVIEKFEFYIKAESITGENIYTFVFPAKNNVLLDRYDSRSVYEFKRDNPSFDIKPGTYYVVCKFLANKNSVTLTKPFSISEIISTSLFLRDDFWPPFESGNKAPSGINAYIRVKNSSPQNQEYRFGVYNLKLTRESRVISSTRQEVKPGEIYLSSGEAIDIPLESIDIPEEAGQYQLEWSFFVNDRLEEGSHPILIEPLSSSESFNKLRILSYSLKVIGQGEAYASEVLIANDLAQDVFLRVDEFHFYIYQDRNELFHFKSDTVMYIRIYAHSSRILFRSEEWKKIQFDHPGNYLIRTSIKTHQGELVQEEEMTVIEKSVSPP
jgi:hypothetical protein